MKFNVETHAPDRLVLLDGGQVAFIEFKQPGKKPTRGQQAYMKALQKLGFKATWADDALDAIAWIDHEFFSA